MAGPGAAFRRLGALSGAGALGLASYGAHGQGPGVELGCAWGDAWGLVQGWSLWGLEGSQPSHSLRSPKPFNRIPGLPVRVSAVRSLLGAPFSPVPAGVPRESGRLSW